VSVHRLDQDATTPPGDLTMRAFGIDPGALRGLSPAERFGRLRDRFESEMAFVSSVHDMLDANPFRDIVAMGHDALPLLLRDLQRRDAPWIAWVIALRKILGEGPEIPDDEAGIRDKVLARWAAWHSGRT